MLVSVFGIVSFVFCVFLDSCNKVAVLLSDEPPWRGRAYWAVTVCQEMCFCIYTLFDFLLCSFSVRGATKEILCAPKMLGVFNPNAQVVRHIRRIFARNLKKPSGIPCGWSAQPGRGKLSLLGYIDLYPGCPRLRCAYINIYTIMYVYIRLRLLITTPKPLRRAIPLSH